MTIERCAILGAGAGGQVMAADLTLAGVDVTLYEMPRFRSNIAPITERGGIELTGAGRQGFARMHTVTTDLASAIKGIQYLFVTMQAQGHAIIAKELAPHLEDGHVIILFPGYGGSLLISRILKDMKVDKRISIGETLTLPYSAKLPTPGTAFMRFAVGPTHPFAVFPGRDTEKYLDDLKSIYPALAPAKNVLEPALLNPNILKHPMILFSLSRIESSDEIFCLNREGMTPSVWKIFYKVDAERKATLDTIGANGRKYMEVHKLINPMTYEEFERTTKGIKINAHHRYFTEDVPNGLVLLSSLGHMIGVETPTTDSIIQQVSVIHEKDYFKEGRTVEKLGIAGMTGESLAQYLAEGE